MQAVDINAQSRPPKQIVMPAVQQDPDALRWLVEREGVDFGPFSQRQILDQLADGTLTPNSVLADVEREMRRTLAEFGEFETAMLQWVHRKDDREVAERRAEKEHRGKRDRQFKVWGGLALVLVLGVVIGTWQYVGSNRPEPIAAHLANTVTSLEWALPSIPAPEPEEVVKKIAPPPKVRKKRYRSPKKWSSAELAQMRREEQLASNSELGAGGANLGEFSRKAYDRVLARRTSRLYRCLMSEVTRRPGTKDMLVRTTVLPSGKIINVKMAGGTVAGVRCIRRAFTGARVPAFAGSNVKITLPFRLE